MLGTGKQAHFGELVFGRDKLKTSVDPDIFRQYESAVAEGKRLPKQVTNAIANALKHWALGHGVTHYCHWFQPLTFSTAEKHDGFLSMEPAQVLHQFTGSMLSHGEPDASSFPSGGMRTTFEARGYTAWDPSSPPFIRKNVGGGTLCIPSVFFSYHGETLDLKTPLLRSIKVLDKAARRMLALFDVEVGRVFSTVGAEQEFFLIDREVYRQRRDLVLTGRTLFGAPSPRGQQLSDHYFGAIDKRVMEFYHDVDERLYALGIPAKTRHNEVAPRQFELACIFREANLACDQNLLVMDILRNAARDHGMECLLHEKPFQGINGSGKHLNWSMATDTGLNLLEPGVQPEKNLQFLAFLVATVEAVHRYAPLLRASIASNRNDLRLGAHEAPPAIMSVFLGAKLTSVLAALENKALSESDAQVVLDTGLPEVPSLERHDTDRNRTSPFAFTGNKFEFRAAGSSTQLSVPATAINCMVAERIEAIAAEVEQRVADGADLQGAMLDVLAEHSTACRAVRFEGDNYTGDWVAEAESRGLPNTRTTPKALQAYADETQRKLFIDGEVLTGLELDARLNVSKERYVMLTEIEAKTMVLLAERELIPTGLRTQAAAALSVERIKEFNRSGQQLDVAQQAGWLKNMCTGLEELIRASVQLKESLGRLESQEVDEQMDSIENVVLPQMTALRTAADSLEGYVGEQEWPLPSYVTLLFGG